jgi:hypothetical protein
VKSNSSINFVTLAGAFFIAAASAWTPVQAQDQRHIKREQIDSMFSSMRATAPWNVDGPLLWGYFFFSPTREKLGKVAAELEGKGYRIVGIEAPRGKLRLHVERVETHTPASLDARNQELYALAERYGVSYDGMDVGPVQIQEKK